MPLFTKLLLLFFSFSYAVSALADKSRFDATKLSRVMPIIAVKGNQFINEEGKTFTFRGMSIADPDKLVTEGRWNKRIFEELASWGANTVRLPIHPVAWRKQGKEQYLALIDEAIIWANELNMYVIVDWHSIGYLTKGLFPKPDYETNTEETIDFWKTIAHRYKGVSTVALYELFNEPSNLALDVEVNWNEWKHFNEQLIDIIYDQDKQVIPLVAGFDWAYDLTPIKESPINRPGIGYVSHPYPQKAGMKQLPKRTYFDRWEKSWGYVAEKYPVVTTEIGWVKEGGFGAHIPVLNDGEYGPIIMEYLDDKGISWIGWAFDPLWSPVMIKNWDFEPSEQGKFFKKVLLEKQ